MRRTNDPKGSWEEISRGHRIIYSEKGGCFIEGRSALSFNAQAVYGEREGGGFHVTNGGAVSRRIVFLADRGVVAGRRPNRTRSGRIVLPLEWRKGKPKGKRNDQERREISHEEHHKDFYPLLRKNQCSKSRLWGPGLRRLYKRHFLRTANSAKNKPLTNRKSHKESAPEPARQNGIRTRPGERERTVT